MLNYEIHNQDAKEETIVCVHGLQSSLRTWDTLIPTLPKSWKIITIDQKGHGKSPVLNDSFTSESMAKDLNQTLEHLDIQNFHLLGHSMGGRTGLAYSGLFPQKIKSLIVEDIGMEQRLKKSQEELENLRKTFDEWNGRSLIFDSKEEILNLLKPLFSYADGLMESKVSPLDNGRFELLFNPGIASLYGAEGNISDLKWSLEKTEFPVLFMIADPEVGSAINEEGRDYIKNHIPRAKEVYFPGSWHNIHKSKQNEFSSCLIKWIEKGLAEA